MGSAADGFRTTVRRLLALERDVLVLSVAMFAFSLGFQQLQGGASGLKERTE